MLLGAFVEGSTSGTAGQRVMASLPCTARTLFMATAPDKTRNTAVTNQLRDFFFGVRLGRPARKNSRASIASLRDEFLEQSAATYATLMST